MKYLAFAKTVFVVSLLCLTFSVPLGGIGLAEKPDVIKLFLISDLSGPYAPSHSKFIGASEDACEYVNTQLGGVDGVPIEVQSLDTGNKVDMATYHYMKLREMEPKPLFIMLGVSGEAEALRPRLGEDQIPGFVVPSTSCLYPAEYSFGAYPTYPDQFGAFIDWLKANWKENRPPRLAFLTWDTTFGKAVLTDECYEYAKSKGVEVVATELYGIKDLDVMTQLVRIRAKKADWIFSNTAFQGTVIVGKGLKEMKSDIKLAAGIGLDRSTMRIDPKALEGTFAFTNAMNFEDTKDSGVATVMKYFNKNGRTEKDKALMYSLAWYYVSVAREAINNAVKKSGWDKLNGAAVKEEVTKMKDFVPVGKGLSPFSYSDKKRSPSAIRLFQIKSGNYVPVTDWFDAPDLRASKYK